MAKDLPFYQMYPKDFDTDENVRVLNLAEAGLFLFCLNHSWMNDGLPNDPLEIGRALRVPQKEFTKLWVRVGKCFRTNADGRLINGRQEDERLKAITRSRRSTDAIKRRWNGNTEADTEPIPNGYHGITNPHTRASESVSDSVFSSENLNQEIKTIPRAREKTTVISADFDPFWVRWCALTGRKQKESDARRAWIGSVEPDAVPLAMACLERYGASGDVARGAISNPDKWIYDQASDNWTGDWPGPRNTPPTGSKQSRARSVLAELIQESEGQEVSSGKTDGTSGSEITWKIIAYSAVPGRRPGSFAGNSPHIDPSFFGSRYGWQGNRRAA